MTRDHLDFHQSEENYFNAKARLFEGLDDVEGSKAIVNVDGRRRSETIGTRDGAYLHFLVAGRMPVSGSGR